MAVSCFKGNRYEWSRWGVVVERLRSGLQARHVRGLTLHRPYLRLATDDDTVCLSYTHARTPAADHPCLCTDRRDRVPRARDVRVLRACEACGDPAPGESSRAGEAAGDAAAGSAAAEGR